MALGGSLPMAEKSKYGSSHGKVLVGCSYCYRPAVGCNCRYCSTLGAGALIFPSDALLNGCWRCGTGAPGDVIVCGAAKPVAMFPFGLHWRCCCVVSDHYS
ncbi:hypothetical protein Nepgr_002658 [Nepenthes gracilis]|uniref:Uncharacterized protein n=1 Tax=Nepenthes gracilis TaxID=150966 RepID=A0AAD3P9W7_NEPGR|nr:hypothetical protein Nepgr_002658 [Nepenthes gracilis]